LDFGGYIAGILASRCYGWLLFNTYIIVISIGNCYLCNNYYYNF
jgi:hypothetical protein